MASFSDAVDALRSAERGAGLGARLAANSMAETFTAHVQAELRAKSHPFQTKTPSVAPEPPAMISGHLADSMDITPAFPIGGDAWMSKTGPTVIYSRIQELGGTMHGHPIMKWIEDGVSYTSAVHDLPKRPYMKPVEETLVADGTLTDVAERAFRVVNTIMLA